MSGHSKPSSTVGRPTVIRALVAGAGLGALGAVICFLVWVAQAPPNEQRGHMMLFTVPMVAAFGAFHGLVGGVAAACAGGRIGNHLARVGVGIIVGVAGSVLVGYVLYTGLASITHLDQNEGHKPWYSWTYLVAADVVTGAVGGARTAAWTARSRNGQVAPT